MSTKIIPILKQQFCDDNGDPLAGGFLYTYQANSVTPMATYTDRSGGTMNTNPVVLDSGGRAAVWCTTGLYKFVLKDSSGTTIYTIDEVRVEPVDSTADAVADSIPAVVGSRASPQAIVAGTGIAFTGTCWLNSWHITGSGGAVDISANPQIAAATNVGQRLRINAHSDTNTVKFEDGTGLDMNGAFIMGASTWIEFEWDGTYWSEVSRSAR